MVPALGEEYGFAADATNLGSGFFDEDFGDVDVDHDDDDDLDDDVYDVSALNEDDDDDDMDDTAAFFESADECDDEYGDDDIDDMLYDMYAGEPTVGCRCQFIVNHRVKDLRSTINKVFRQNRDLSSVMDVLAVRVIIVPLERCPSSTAATAVVDDTYDADDETVDGTVDGESTIAAGSEVVANAVMVATPPEPTSEVTAPSATDEEGGSVEVEVVHNGDGGGSSEAQEKERRATSGGASKTTVPRAPKVVKLALYGQQQRRRQSGGGAIVSSSSAAPRTKDISPQDGRAHAAAPSPAT